MKSLRDSFIERFCSNITKNIDNDCWEWIGPKQGPMGYGYIYGAPEKLAHRLAWHINFGPIPKKLCVLHTCDNPACCNPNHLSLGTHKDNTQDMIRKGRGIKGETVGTSKLTTEQVVEIRQLSKSGKTGKTLAKEFGVRRSEISRIINGVRWSWLGDNRDELSTSY